MVLDVAKGLEYLHHHTYAGPFIHKHLKSSNILLDIELHAQIAYFGVAKIRDQMGMSAAAAESQGSSRSTPSTSGEQREQKGSCRLRSSTVFFYKGDATSKRSPSTALNFQTISQHPDFRETWVHGTRGESWWFDHTKARCVCIWCDFVGNCVKQGGSELLHCRSDWHKHFEEDSSP